MEQERERQKRWLELLKKRRDYNDMVKVKLLDLDHRIKPEIPPTSCHEQELCEDCPSPEGPDKCENYVVTCSDGTKIEAYADLIKPTESLDIDYEKNPVPLHFQMEDSLARAKMAMEEEQKERERLAWEKIKLVFHHKPKEEKEVPFVVCPVSTCTFEIPAALAKKPETTKSGRIKDDNYYNKKLFRTLKRANMKNTRPSNVRFAYDPDSNCPKEPEEPEPEKEPEPVKCDCRTDVFPECKKQKAGDPCKLIRFKPRYCTELKPDYQLLPKFKSVLNPVTYPELMLAQPCTKCIKFADQEKIDAQRALEAEEKRLLREMRHAQHEAALVRVCPPKKIEVEKEPPKEVEKDPPVCQTRNFPYPESDFKCRKVAEIQTHRERQSGMEEEDKIKNRYKKCYLHCSKDHEKLKAWQIPKGCFCDPDSDSDSSVKLSEKHFCPAWMRKKEKEEEKSYRSAKHGWRCKECVYLKPNPIRCRPLRLTRPLEIPVLKCSEYCLAAEPFESCLEGLPSRPPRPVRERPPPPEKAKPKPKKFDRDGCPRHKLCPKLLRCRKVYRAVRKNKSEEELPPFIPTLDSCDDNPRLCKCLKGKGPKGPKGPKAPKIGGPFIQRTGKPKGDYTRHTTQGEQFEGDQDKRKSSECGEGPSGSDAYGTSGQSSNECGENAGEQDVRDQSMSFGFRAYYQPKRKPPKKSKKRVCTGYYYAKSCKGRLRGGHDKASQEYNILANTESWAKNISQDYDFEESFESLAEEIFKSQGKNRLQGGADCAECKTRKNPKLPTQSRLTNSKSTGEKCVTSKNPSNNSGHNSALNRMSARTSYNPKNCEGSTVKHTTNDQLCSKIQSARKTISPEVSSKGKGSLQRSNQKVIGPTKASQGSAYAKTKPNTVKTPKEQRAKSVIRSRTFTIFTEKGSNYSVDSPIILPVIGDGTSVGKEKISYTSHTITEAADSYFRALIANYDDFRQDLKKQDEKIIQLMHIQNNFDKLLNEILHEQKKMYETHNKNVPSKNHCSSELTSPNKASNIISGHSTFKKQQNLTGTNKTKPVCKVKACPKQVFSIDLQLNGNDYRRMPSPMPQIQSARPSSRRPSRIYKLRSDKPTENEAKIITELLNILMNDKEKNNANKEHTMMGAIGLGDIQTSPEERPLLEIVSLSNILEGEKLEEPQKCKTILDCKIRTVGRVYDMQVNFELLRISGTVTDYSEA